MAGNGKHIEIKGNFLVRSIAGICAVILASTYNLSAQRYEPVQFGDFEQWTVREITESAIIGGNKVLIYEVAPNDTIRANEPFDYSKTIWSNSNAFAKVMGVIKTSVSVSPDEGPTGKCAKLKTGFAHCRVAGLVSIRVLAQGSIFWGKTFEPITGVSDPYAFMDWGLPFTKKPKAIVLDYKSVIPNTGKLTKGTTFKTTTYDGYDPAEILLILQHRKEDEKGNIHVQRVGTAIYHIDKTSDGWKQNFRVPVIYGDATKDPSYKPYMDLINSSERAYYAVNKKGKRVPLIEDDWAPEGTQPTHAILQISSGCLGAFKGALDNVLWVDNIKLEY